MWPLKEKNRRKKFSWTNDELQLLLQVALDYKAKCQFNANVWETKRQKYEDIFDILLKKYPDEKEKYPNKEKMNKERVAVKLKSIQSEFKKAIECGKKKWWKSCGFSFCFI